ncbi:hypothetical protein [Janthinobacterium sp.]|uniref:hypothetical protein n=1 Tax=Janthinobacterium sp. TaxID=1871054 RepID=UPI0026310F1E|nr:hypothetical protein [Janthinobacterium sp.]
MKAKAMRLFIDKYTDAQHEEGTEIEVTKERFKEINSTEYGKLLEEIKTKK